MTGLADDLRKAADAGKPVSLRLLLLRAADELDRLSGRNPLTAYICDECRGANLLKRTHPGVRHLPGTCDCACRR